jgi:hypothetical protein
MMFCKEVKGGDAIKGVIAKLPEKKGGGSWLDLANMF